MMELDSGFGTGGGTTSVTRKKVPPISVSSPSGTSTMISPPTTTSAPAGTRLTTPTIQPPPTQAPGPAPTPVATPPAQQPTMYYGGPANSGEGTQVVGAPTPVKQAATPNAWSPDWNPQSSEGATPRPPVLPAPTNIGGPSIMSPPTMAAGSPGGVLTSDQGMQDYIQRSGGVSPINPAMLPTGGGPQLPTGGGTPVGPMLGTQAYNDQYAPRPGTTSSLPTGAQTTMPIRNPGEDMASYNARLAAYHMSRGATDAAQQSSAAADDYRTNANALAGFSPTGADYGKSAAWSAANEYAARLRAENPNLSQYQADQMAKQAGGFNWDTHSWDNAEGENYNRLLAVRDAQLTSGQKAAIAAAGYQPGTPEYQEAVLHLTGYQGTSLADTFSSDPSLPGTITWGDGTTVDAPSGGTTILPPGMFGPGAGGGAGVPGAPGGPGGAGGGGLPPGFGPSTGGGRQDPVAGMGGNYAGGSGEPAGTRIGALTGNERPYYVMPGQGGRQTELMDSLFGEAQRQLRDPSPYDDELFQSSIDAGTREIDAYYGNLERRLKANLGARGAAYDSTIAAGDFNTLSSEQGRAVQDMIRPLMRERAASIGSAREAAFRNAMSAWGAGDNVERADRAEYRTERDYVDDQRRQARNEALQEMMLEYETQYGQEAGQQAFWQSLLGAGLPWQALANAGGAYGDQAAVAGGQANNWANFAGQAGYLAGGG